MKSVLFFITILVINLQSIDLDNVRSSYKEAASNAVKVIPFNNMLQEVTKDDRVELIAYKGSGIALKGRFSKKIKDKRTFFIEGVSFVEYAIKKAPNNIELRFIRLGIQENTPKILKYKGNITEDKLYILSHFRQITSSKLKKHIKEYIIQSKVFTVEEKLSID
jgi:hypothetical protein